MSRLTTAFYAAVFIVVAICHCRGAEQTYSEETMQRAKKGNPQALYEIGLYYDKSDHRTAKEWMERAARQGSAKAKEWLRTYKAGQEKFEHNQRWAESAVERELDAPRLAREAARLAQEQRSLKEAELLAHQRQNEKLLEDAAESGEAKNQFQLGVRFLQGDGVRKDLAKAIKWIRKSADKGDPEAQFKLADLYKNGIGVAQNLVESAKWCKQAAERGLVTAQAELGFNYMTGTGLTMDMVEAAKWFRMAAEQGLSTAQYNL